MSEKCTWTQEPASVIWNTECGQVFETSIAPTRQEFKFCPFCGRHLIERSNAEVGRG